MILQEIRCSECHALEKTIHSRMMLRVENDVLCMPVKHAQTFFLRRKTRRWQVLELTWIPLQK